MMKKRIDELTFADGRKICESNFAYSWDDCCYECTNHCPISCICGCAFNDTMFDKHRDDIVEVPE